jgi:hypothetical protein
MTKGLNRGKKSRSVRVENLEGRQLLSAVVQPLLQVDPAASSGSVQGYTPSQIRTAYDVSSADLSNGSAATGAGQTIAIVDAYNDPNIASDLSAFDTKFGLGAASLTVVNQNGSSKAKNLPQDNAGWDLEISLDVEWAHVIAPQANILLVETQSDSTNSLLAGVKYAASVPGVSVVSMSWGGSEFSSETSDDSYFTTPSGHQGITFVAASGDDGPMSGAEWPASSPDVLGVGGTTLNLTSSGAYGSESAWSGSSGGYSQIESELSYQSDVQTTGYRSAPDVSFDANPNTGVAVYDSVRYQGVSGWQVIGGTSEGAPQWAGLIALADQDRVASGLGTLNGTDQTLPTLYSEYGTASTDAAAFNKISGSNTYNESTGLGSPIANAVVSDLFNAVTTTPTVVPVPAPTQTFPTGGEYHHRGYPVGPPGFPGGPTGGLPVHHTGGFPVGHGGFFAEENLQQAATLITPPAETQLPTAAAPGSADLLAVAMYAGGDQSAAQPIAQANIAASSATISGAILHTEPSAAAPATHISTIIAPTTVATTSTLVNESAHSAAAARNTALSVFSSAPMIGLTLDIHAAIGRLNYHVAAAWAAGVLLGVYVVEESRRNLSKSQSEALAYPGRFA